MLIELRIKDFAIIDSLAISFGPGLNVFTGETGAGKSIIIDALALILGDRASNETIRSNAEEAVVEALFDVTGNKAVEAVVKEAGIPPSDSLVVRRVIQKAGRNKIYINGSLATLVTLIEVVRRLVDIYGQSEHQSLTRQEEHIEVLDAFAGLAKARTEMAAAYRHFTTIKKELDGLVQNPKSNEERLSLLRFQMKEIADAALRPGQDVELKKEYELLKNAERIRASLSEADRAIYSDTGSIVERLGSVVKSLKDASLLDDKIVQTVEAVETTLAQLEDVGAFLRDYSQTIEADPEAIEHVGGRLDHIIKLKKKYGATIEDIIAKGAAIEHDLAGLSGLDDKIKALEKEAAVARENAQAVSGSLTQARHAAAIELKKKIETELASLGMQGTVFEAHVETDKAPDGNHRFGEKGSDRVTFLISPNQGEEVKPLARIASGGELSRIMLAMKSATFAARVPTLVFDEIDTGVSGAMAQVVGLKLKEAAGRNQVLCITHLPHIAAFADRHFAVKKQQTKDSRTVTTVMELKGNDAVEQISKMLGGVSVTDVTREHAKELVVAAHAMLEKSAGAKKTEK